jgi:hypothetical protein
MTHNFKKCSKCTNGKYRISTWEIDEIEHNRHQTIECDCCHHSIVVTKEELSAWKHERFINSI